MAQLPSGTVTFLFTDIEGSTRLLQTLGQDVYAKCLADHNALIREAIAETDGIALRTEGDAFFAVFTTVPGAIGTVVAAQRALHGHPWPEGAQLRVRMGLHTGTGIPGGDNYVGIDVHRAARIADAAHGGQVLLSAATAALVAPQLPRGIGLGDVGEHRLKDLAQAEHLHQLVISGLPAEFPPLRSLDAVPNNLPVQLTSFVGRDAELAEAVILITERRLVTLTGPGGTGKTRLALQIAAEITDEFSDGVFFVPLARISDPDLVPTTVLESLGLHTTAAGVEPTDHLRGYVSALHLLLVLDNFEQLVAAAPLVSDLLRAAPELKVIVTSRVPLQISGEQEMPVPPLYVPHLEGPVNVEEIAHTEGVELFTDRALAVRPDFELGGHNAEAVAQLTARLDGLPLAIELAASRIRVLSPEAIVERLDNRLLSSPASDLPERQRTITNTIGWSYDLLEEPARRLFERCAVFVGSTSLSEIESVCGPADEIGIDVLDGLGALVDHSLVRHTESAGESRFGMLLVIREFAYAALVARGDEDELRRRHASVYVELAAQAEPHLLTGRRGQWLDRLATDHDNIRAALDWAIASEDAKAALSIVGALWRFWQIRGHLYAARERIDQALALPGDYPRLRARALEASGGVAYWRGDFPATRGPYQEAVQILRGHGEPSELAHALYNLSFALVGGGEYEEARAALAESLAISEQLDDRLGIGRAYWGMFNIAFYQGDHDEALDHAGRAAAEFEKLDAPFDLGWAWFGTGDMLLRLGQMEAALGYLQRALPFFVDAGDLSAMVVFIYDLAAVALLEGDRARAARLSGATVALKEKTGAALIDAWGIAKQELDELVAEVDEEMTAEFEKGRRMSVEAAVAYALDESYEPG